MVKDKVKSINLLILKVFTIKSKELILNDGVKMINIRKSQEKDAKRMVEINVETWKVAYRNLLPDEYLDNRNVTQKRITDLANKLKDNEIISFVAEIDGEIVGFCNGGEARDKDYPFEYELCAIYVHPSYQNKGIGQALFDAFKVKTQDCPFYLYALKGNLPAISFYIKNGGLEIPEYEKALPIENVDATEILFAFQL